MIARAASGRTSFGETFGAAGKLAASAHEPSFGVPLSAAGAICPLAAIEVPRGGQHGACGLARGDEIAQVRR
jgi:hypothetical protein